MASDYDAPPAAKSGLEKWYTDQFIIAIIVSVCCGCIGLIVNIIGFATVKDPKAKSNATTCLIISGVLAVLGVLGGIVNVMMSK